MADTDRTPLVSHAEPPAQINVPKSPLLLKLSEKVRREQAETNAVKQPMLSTSTPTPPAQPEPEKGTDPEKGPGGPPPPYSAFLLWRRRFILIIITVAGFFGPLAGGIYLPALPGLEHEFQASATAINITVSVFMLTFAFGVRKTIYPNFFRVYGLTATWFSPYSGRVLRIGRGVDLYILSLSRSTSARMFCSPLFRPTTGR